MAVEEKIDFSEVVDCSHPITQYWKPALMPTVCKRHSFHYASQTVERGSAEWGEVERCFNLQPNCHTLMAAWRVQNLRLLRSWNAYYSQLKEDLATDHQEEKLAYRMVYHGCSSPENLNSIAHGGFDVIYSSSETSVNAFGHGVYFGSTPEVSAPYCCEAPKELRYDGGAPQGSQVVFLSFLVTADVMRGERKVLKPPLIEGSKSGRRYDTLCNRLEKPSIYVATNNAQAYPAYILSFQ